ncbi:MAG: macrolide ABC transporter ATP-binding protein [Candidatus Andersenbacteria bacterium RIFCSPHIGHO2_12_FULL_46_9]|nr:MAG: macrolide ABC transporter ATP-binding protein [Candidatus Andersenbacteria bacterium RIFCSPHIGHO2_02_FULL_46_16]OGY37998.1 MAG: macrolide ABC transporter ATP-binding protein [Candidatus Andersenbacteria bacterium RIFCSPHIGHO2_12_FULL_46_9]
MIEVKNVAKIYQEDTVATAALTNISFNVTEGEFIAIMGASGSGKSTLLHILGLLDHPSQGIYRLNNVNTAELTDIQRSRIRNNKIGFVFQAFHLLARTSVLENVMLPLQYSSLPRSQHIARAKQALAQVDMTHRIDHKPSQLSGGEKQRTCIARALVTQPQVLLADEPTGNLDSITGNTVMELIDHLHKQGLTIIVITHETPTADYAQRIIKLRDGQIISDQLSQARHHHYQK